MLKPVFLVIGKLRRPFGVHGELVMEVITDFPERIRKGVDVFLGEDHIPVQIQSQRKHTEGLIISFKGYSTPESTAVLRNMWVYVRADDRPKLPEGNYYQHQLLGLQVYTLEGQLLGELIEILETGANDVYLVRPENGSEILIPANPEFVKNIDLEKNRIDIALIPGIVQEKKE